MFGIPQLHLQVYFTLMFWPTLPLQDPRENLLHWGLVLGPVVLWRFRENIMGKETPIIERENVVEMYEKDTAFLGC